MLPPIDPRGLDQGIGSESINRGRRPAIPTTSHPDHVPQRPNPTPHQSPLDIVTIPVASPPGVTRINPLPLPFGQGPIPSKGATTGGVLTSTTPLAPL